MWNDLKKVLIGEKPAIDVWHYFVGNYRYWLYSNRLKKMIRDHILEQIEWRLQVVNRECYESGSCVKCGCQVPQLQMCDKACVGNCYPNMMDKEAWEKFRKTE